MLQYISKNKPKEITNYYYIGNQKSTPITSLIWIEPKVKKPRIVWESVTAYIFTNDGYYGIFNDGYIDKFND